MSLRARVVCLIGAVLLISMLLGTLVAGYQVRQALRAELAAGLTGAEQTVQRAFEDLPTSDHPARDLRQLVATFDGNRHIRATLTATDGRTAAMSRTIDAAKAPPPWFRRLLGVAPSAATINVPKAISGFRAIVLAPTADLDVDAAWREFVSIVMVLSGSAALGLILVYLVIGAAFRPLMLLAGQFGRIGTGDYSGRVAVDGPAELIGLQAGFNDMVSELAGAKERNRLLTDQLLTIQDEERADIARDLHDEIGPHLFAVNVDAEMIVQLCETGRHDGVPVQARSIQSGVNHMQRQVRDLLSRLRPTQVTELGLNAAILDQVRFWTLRRPEIAFGVTLLDDEARLPEATKDVVYRIVQEAANNAVRHGNPNSIRITVEFGEDGVLVVTVADDGVHGKAGPVTGGLGLVGMRERVEASGGSLTFGPTGRSHGWTTAARLPLESAASPPSKAALSA
jgi:two-component system sensor histidine kinase UhpB